MARAARAPDLARVSDPSARRSPGADEPDGNGWLFRIPEQLVLTKERPHLTRGINALARRPDPPFRQRLPARPRVTSPLDGVEDHRRVVSTARVFAPRDIRGHERIAGLRSTAVSSRPARHPILNGRKGVLHGVERVTRRPPAVRHD